MLYILAENNGDALQYAKDHELEAGSYKIATTPEKMQGVDGRENSLAVTSNAVKRADFALMIATLRDRGFDF